MSTFNPTENSLTSDFTGSNITSSSTNSTGTQHIKITVDSPDYDSNLFLQKSGGIMSGNIYMAVRAYFCYAPP